MKKFEVGFMGNTPFTKNIDAEKYEHDAKANSMAFYKGGKVFAMFYCVSWVIEL